jgi:hypothetical protein
LLTKTEKEGPEVSPDAEEGLPGLPLFLGEQSFEAPREMGRFSSLILLSYAAAACGLRCVKGSSCSK